MSKPKVPRYIRDLLAEDCNSQWLYDGHTGSTHIRLRHLQTGRCVIAAATPSCIRATKNLVANMRRVEREAMK